MWNVEENANTRLSKEIQSLLMHAWREHWSEVQWSIQIKSVLPKNVSGDAHNLAQCMLQQGLIGPSPNKLIFSYLQIVLSSELVSYAAVLQAISKFNNLNKTKCVQGLLELLCTFIGRLKCSGNAEECMALCTSLTQVVKWTVQCLHHSVMQMADVQNCADYLPVTTLACDFLTGIIDNAFTMSLFYVGQLECKNTWTDIENVLADIAKSIQHQLSSSVDKEKINCVCSGLKTAAMAPKRVRNVSNDRQPLCDVSIALVVEAILNPADEVQLFVKNMDLVGTLENLPRSELYCEMVKASIQGIVSSGQTSNELRWNAFAFIKLPIVIAELTKSGKRSDVIDALNSLLKFGPLLHAAETKTNCDCIEVFTKEFAKVGIVTEQQLKDITDKRTADEQKPKAKKEQSALSVTNSNPSLILRAESTITSILRTLDAEYSKNQEGLLGVLCQMLSGKSFELILGAAAASGKLQDFVDKLMKFNEISKQVQGENPKAAQIRALLFDISFLMLCHICQLYGTKFMESSAPDSFFKLWASKCLPLEGNYKSMDTLLTPDSNKVELLVQQFQSGGELKLSLAKWNDMCLNVPAAVQEVLFAWEAGNVTAENVKKLLEVIQGRMCCLPVCVCAWLCNYVYTANHDDRQKPVQMIQQLLSPMVNSDPSNNQNYSERHSLMTMIVRRMFHHIQPTFNAKANFEMPPLLAKTAAADILVEIFQSSRLHGWMPLKSVPTLTHILNTAGCNWYVATLVRELLKLSHPDDLRSGTRVIVPMFMVNMFGCTLSLIRHTIPEILLSKHKLDMVIDPRGQILAKLLFCCITFTLATQQNKLRQDLSEKQSTKDHDSTEVEKEMSADDTRPAKVPRLLGNHSLSGDTPVGLICDSKGLESPPFDMDDPLNSALIYMFKLFRSLISTCFVSQQTWFIFTFLEEIAACRTETSSKLLQFMPVSLVSQLIKCFPKMFTPELIVLLCDNSSTLGRKITTKVLCEHQGLVCGASQSTA